MPDFHTFADQLRLFDVSTTFASEAQRSFVIIHIRLRGCSHAADDRVQILHILRISFSQSFECNVLPTSPSAPSLHILVDENIPFGEAAFTHFGTVRRRAGRAISAEDLSWADVLLVRSVTRVDSELLGDSELRFVGSATIGTDHVDGDLLRARGIPFAHAPGSNAESVVEYVLAALAILAVRKGSPLVSRTVGVVGCGNIGGRLAARLEHLGVHVLRCDPPLAEAAEACGESHPYLPLEALIERADTFSFHVPLERDGPYPTHHLASEAFFGALPDGAWLLNSSRGAVVDNHAALRAAARGRLGGLVLDVWEDEPTPMPDLLARCDLATPHIAGYSYDGKVGGTIMLYEALREALNLPDRWDHASLLAPRDPAAVELRPIDPVLPPHDALDRLMKQMYDLRADDARFRKMLALPDEERGGYFSELRRTYPRRRSFARWTGRQRWFSVEVRGMLEALGVG